MRIKEFRLRPLRIPFKAAFRHASAERTQTSSVWIEALSAGGAIGCGESCPRPYVTGESLDTVGAFLARHEASLVSAIGSVSTLQAWAAAHADEVNANPAAWCAIELAVLDLLAKEAGTPVEALLRRPSLTGTFHYTAVLGDDAPGPFAATAGRYAAAGFRDFKIKLSGDAARDAAKAQVLKALEPPPARIRGDANNRWQTAEEAIVFLRTLGLPLFALEEPIAPRQYLPLALIGKALACRVVLDESLLRLEDLDHLRDDPGRWLINIRVSKMGGLLRSLAVVDAARSAGVGIVVGAQVGETSLLTRAALIVAQAAGDALVAQEGAFGTALLERDVCDPPLMFGKCGVLDIAMYPGLTTSPGFGLGSLTYA
jgi:L-Ala-D/L-Glu epimerase